MKLDFELDSGIVFFFLVLIVVCRVFRDQFVLLWETERERIVDGALTGRTENGMMGCFLETDSNIVWQINYTMCIEFRSGNRPSWV